MTALPPEPWWFAELDPTNRTRVQALWETEREAAARYARELADLRIKLALTCDKVDRLQALLDLNDQFLLPPP